MADTPLTPCGEIVLYAAEDGRARVECDFPGETVWLRRALMAELCKRDVRTINAHLKNIHEEGEQDADATIRRFRAVRREGSREVARLVDHHNLDADARAEAEYEASSASRPAYLDAKSERAGDRALEAEAKGLPNRGKTPRRRRS